MTLIEYVMLSRAQEQLDAGAFRRADKGEHLVKLPPPDCEVCGNPSEQGPRKKGRPVKNAACVCRACRLKGYRARRCDCGKPLHTRDYASSRPGSRWAVDRCGACRRAVLEVA